MNPQQDVKDLIVLAADKSMKLAVDQLLIRPSHLGFSPISSDVRTHQDRDPGVFRQSHEFLRGSVSRYRHAIAICDHHGSGSDAPREELEKRIEQQLRANGWDDRAAAIVIDPELEIWMWGDWATLARRTDWSGDESSLKDWLRSRTLLRPGEAKPRQPKEALQRVLKQTGKPWSSAIHESMAANAVTSECVDAAFQKFKLTLQQWFPL